MLVKDYKKVKECIESVCRDLNNLCEIMDLKLENMKLENRVYELERMLDGIVVADVVEDGNEDGWKKYKLVHND